MTMMIGKAWLLLCIANFFQRTLGSHYEMSKSSLIYNLNNSDCEAKARFIRNFNHANPSRICSLSCSFIFKLFLANIATERTKLMSILLEEQRKSIGKLSIFQSSLENHQAIIDILQLIVNSGLSTQLICLFINIDVNSRLDIEDHLKTCCSHFETRSL